MIRSVRSRLPLHGDLSYLLPPEMQSVRDLHSLEARAQVFGTIIVGVDSDRADQRLATASLLSDRLHALPASAVISVSADSATRDQFAWAHRQLLIPTEDLQAMADDLRARKARLNPLFVSLDSPTDNDTEKTAAPSVAERLHNLKQQFDAARRGAQSPAPLVSPDGRIQIIIVRTRFAASEVSRNAATVAAVTHAVEEARRLSGGSVRIGATGDVVTTAIEHQALSGGMLRATLFTVAVVALGLLLFFAGSPVAVAALLGALAIGALATFAFARLAVGHLNLATAFLAPIVVGNGINFGIILAGRPFENDFKNLRSSGQPMREARLWNDTINAAFGRGISGGTIIALPTQERARAVAERLRAADAGKPPAERLFARVTTLDDFVPHRSRPQAGPAGADSRAADARHAGHHERKRSAHRRRTETARARRPHRRDRPADRAGLALHRTGRHARAHSAGRHRYRFRSVAHRGSRSIRQPFWRPGSRQ